MCSSGTSDYLDEVSWSQGVGSISSSEHQSMISITSYAEMREIIENFMNSKRFARDAENNYHFLKPGPKSNCARIDAVYTVRAGVTSHIKVQDNDQYWAEEERKFPHLKEIHLKEEMMSAAQPVTTSTGPQTSMTSISPPPNAPLHPFPTPANSPERNEDEQLMQAKEIMTLKRTLEMQRSVPGTARLKDGRPPSKKARMVKNSVR